MNKNKKVLDSFIKMDKEQEAWMMAKHKCEDCAVRVVILKTGYLHFLSLWQCTRCKTVWSKTEDTFYKEGK